MRVAHMISMQIDAVPDIDGAVITMTYREHEHAPPATTPSIALSRADLAGLIDRLQSAHQLLTAAATPLPPDAHRH